MSPSIAWGAGLLTLATGIAAFVCGYRVSARWLKNDPRYKLADQADSLPEAAGVVGLLLPRTLKAIWVLLCALAVMALAGAIHFWVVGGIFADRRMSDLLQTVSLYLSALALWGGATFACGTVCERMARGRKRSV